MQPVDRIIRQIQYAPSPSLRVSCEDVILNWNLATKLLLEEEIDGRPQMCLVELLRQCGATGISADALGWHPGSFCIDDAVPHESSMRLKTRKYGDVSCDCLAVPLIDMEEGAPTGFTWYWRIQEMDPDKEKLFRSDFQSYLSHQLLWDSYAATYDKILPELTHYKEAVSRHVRELVSPDISNVLDVGAGTGNMTEQLLQSGCSVTAVDNSRSMLNFLRSKLEGNFHDRLNVYEQSAERLPQLGDESFDAATSLLALFDMDDGHLALKECLRVLRVGGKIVVTEPKSGINVTRISEGTQRCIEAHPRKSELQRFQKRLRDIGRRLAEERASGGLNSTTVIEVLKAAGVQDIRTEDSHYGECETVVGVKQ